MRSACCLVLLSIVGGATPVRADTLQRARQHYQALEYARALLVLEAVRQKAAGDSPLLAKTWLLEGYTLVALSRTDDAVAAFARALRLSPDIRPQPGSSPKITRPFVRALKQAQRRTRRRKNARIVMLRTAPPVVARRSFEVRARVTGAGLTVRLRLADPRSGAVATMPMATAGSGLFRVTVPGEFSRPKAMLALRAELLDQGEVIGAAPSFDKPASIVRVPAHRAAVLVRSPLRGARVLVNGKKRGRVPLKDFVPVQPGRVVVTIAPPGRDKIQQTLSVTAGETREVLFLQPTGISLLDVTQYSLLGVGATSLIASGIFAALSADAAEDVEQTMRLSPAGGVPTTDFSRVADVDSRGRTFESVAVISLIAGATMTVCGAVMILWRRSRSAQQKTNARTLGFAF